MERIQFISDSLSTGYILSKEFQKKFPISKRVRLDSKGRISIPSELRKILGIEEGFEFRIRFNLKSNKAILDFSDFKEDSYSSIKNDRCGVMVSTKACGAFSPCSNPGAGPSRKKREVDKNG